MTDLNDDQDQEQISEEAKRKAKEREKRDDQDIENVMNTVSGRRFIWKHLTETRIFERCFTGDNNSTNFNEGQRNAGLRIFSDIMRACPDMYLLMAKEAGEDE